MHWLYYRNNWSPPKLIVFFNLTSGYVTCDFVLLVNITRHYWICLITMFRQMSIQLQHLFCWVLCSVKKFAFKCPSQMEALIGNWGGKKIESELWWTGGGGGCWWCTSASCGWYEYYNKIPQTPHLWNDSNLKKRP